MCLIRRFWVAGALAIATFSAPAASTNSDWSVRVWQSDDGLPNNNVNGLVQTPDGYLWLAMPSGLARFDGVRFEEFPTSAFPEAYRNQRIRLLAGSKAGGLCVGVDPGYVVFLNHGTATVVTNNLPQQVLESCAEDGEGALWLSYRGGFVCRVQDGKATQPVPREDLPGGPLCLLVADDHGRIWFSKGPSVGIFRGGEFVTLFRFAKNIGRIAPARGGGVWISAGLQLFKYIEGSNVEDHGRISNETIRGDVNALLEDRTGAVWIGTSSGGLFRHDGVHFENIPVSDLEIESLAEDREGNIWAGTAGGGLNRIRPRLVTLEGWETGAPFQSVQSLAEAPDGTIWATTQDGSLVCYVQNHWTTITNADLASTMLTCVAADHAGNVWIGSTGNKLFCLRDGQITTWDRSKGLFGRLIHALLVSRNGDVWIAETANDALQYMRDGTLHTVEIPPTAHHLWAMTEDTAGNIWAGGQSGTLLRITGQNVADQSALTASVQKTIRCLAPGPDGSLWIGFSAGGIARIKDGRFSRVTPDQGYYESANESAVNQIVMGDQGLVWFGSDRGIFRVLQQELDDVADGRASAVRAIRYGRNEGVPGVQARYGEWPGALRTHDNHIWMPMRSALAIVHPEKLHEDPQPPPVLLNRVIVDDQTVALYGGDMPVGPVVDLGKRDATLTLHPRHRRLEFQFTALSFGPPENIHFQYRLEGIDDHWRDPGLLRSATYSRLPAGDYRLRVKGCNSDGIWNNAGVAFSFSVEPFLWQTWWFRVSMFVLLISTVVAVVRYVSFRRLRLKLQLLEQQAALDKERARIARDIHDDLGGNLTQVTLLLELALRSGGANANGKLAEKEGAPDESAKSAIENRQSAIQQGLAMARQVIKALDETVWAVNPRNDTLSDLINYIAQFAVEFLRTAGITCRVKAPDRLPQLAVSADARHNLFLAVKEALNNIVRHAHATEARLRIMMDGDALVIAIEDNGTGFERAPNGQCDDGLRNMRQRMEEIGGQFSVESIPGTGTRVSLVYPLVAAHKNGRESFFKFRRNGRSAKTN